MLSLLDLCVGLRLDLLKRGLYLDVSLGAYLGILDHHLIGAAHSEVLFLAPLFSLLLGAITLLLLLSQ